MCEHMKDKYEEMISIQLNTSRHIQSIISSALVEMLLVEIKILKDVR